MIRAEGVAKKYGSVVALDHLSLEVGQGEFFSLLGPSGCGKTTFLRIIAGLEQVDRGRLFIGKEDMTFSPPQQRPVNTVFQNFALFPHMTVRDNIAFGLRMNKRPALEIGQRLERIMERVQIKDLDRRYPSQLSGGQKQRVALARALVNEPSVLLLDEPLSALDAKLRRELQVELKLLQRSLRTTFLMVTHDQEEAFVLSDRIALMRDGQIEQTGTGQDLYERPRTQFAARFLGGCNIIEGRAVSVDRANTPLGTLRIDNRLSPGPVWLGIRPEKISLSENNQENCCSARVLVANYLGAQTELLIESEGTELRVVVANSAERPPQPGDALHLHLPPTALFPLLDK